MPISLLPPDVTLAPGYVIPADVLAAILAGEVGISTDPQDPRSRVLFRLTRFFFVKAGGRGKAVADPAEMLTRTFQEDRRTYRQDYQDAAGVWHLAEAPTVRGVRGVSVAGTYVPEIKCDARCQNAKGHKCECSCGGKNHGAGISVRLVPARGFGGFAGFARGFAGFGGFGNFTVKRR